MGCCCFWWLARIDSTINSAFCQTFLKESFRLSSHDLKLQHSRTKSNSEWLTRNLIKVLEGTSQSRYSNGISPLRDKRSSQCSKTLQYGWMKTILEKPGSPKSFKEMQKTHHKLLQVFNWLAQLRIRFHRVGNLLHMAGDIIFTLNKWRGHFQTALCSLTLLVGSETSKWHKKAGA